MTSQPNGLVQNKNNKESILESGRNLQVLARRLFKQDLASVTCGILQELAGSLNFSHPLPSGKSLFNCNSPNYKQISCF
jgi:hypothetical protein